MDILFKIFEKNVASITGFFRVNDYLVCFDLMIGQNYQINNVLFVQSFRHIAVFHETIDDIFTVM